MRVTLIDHTGYGHDQWYAADLLIFTKNTRVKLSPNGLSEIRNWPKAKKVEELNYMANTIRSSWEFVDYTFLLEDVTRAFTHQLVRTRHASYAQQTMQILEVDASHVEPPRGTLSEGASKAWQGGVKAVEYTYKEMLAEGATVEQARGILPTNIRTNIVMKANLRTFSEVFGARIGPRNLGEYSEVARAMRDAILEVHPWVSIFLASDRHKYMEKLDAILVQFRDAVPDEQPVRHDLATKALKLVDQLRRQG